MKEWFASLGSSDLIHKTQVPEIPFALTSYGSCLQFSKELLDMDVIFYTVSHLVSQNQKRPQNYFILNLNIFFCNRTVGTRA